MENGEVKMDIYAKDIEMTKFAETNRKMKTYYTFKSKTKQCPACGKTKNYLLFSDLENKTVYNICNFCRKRLEIQKIILSVCEDEL